MSVCGTMRWRGSCGPGGFPAMPAGLTAEDVRNGNVRVVARSPSGRTQQMDVVDVDGMYNTNFTPDEVGDWNVSVLYNGQHIDGSPFNVRVYDPGRVTVFGLDAGLASRNYTFTVAINGAGEGSLTIDITYNGRMIPAQIIPDRGRPGEYNVQFVPQGSGFYTIRVFFAEVEVAGSPFTVEVVDASAISVSGNGLRNAEVQHRAAFTVFTGQSGGSLSDCRITITDPRGTQVPSNIIDEHNGNFRVEFVPVIVGDHLIEIVCHGYPVSGSPFTCKVVDWSQIIVSNLNGMGRVNKTVEFDIDASNAGHGDLEIMVNGGSVPCSVVNRGSRKFHATFTPRLAQPHDIQVKFNGHEVDGSPWRVEILSASQINVSGPGLQLVPVDVMSWFEIHGASGCSDSDLVVNITSPTRKTVRSRLTNLQNGVYRCEYTPPEPGTYTIEVLYDCAAVIGSPFTAKAYDMSAITCTTLPVAFVDKPAEFTVDASRAGEGDLEIIINRGSVPNTAKPLTKGLFTVSFTPREAKVHNIEVIFNGEQCKCCNQSVPVIDVSQIIIPCQSMSVPVNRLTSVKFNTQNAGDAPLEAFITAPGGSNVSNRVSGTSSRGYDVEFTPIEAGIHKMDVTYGGADVPGCPMQIAAYDVGRIKVFDVQDAILGLESSFKVDINGAGEGNLEVSITGPSGGPITNYIRPLSPTVLGVYYSPAQWGLHLINVHFNTEIVNGSPFRVNVMDPSKATARGDGLDMVPCNQLCSFFLSAPSAQLKDFDVKIIGPNSRDVNFRLTDSGTSNFKVDYTPTAPGDYRIEVNYFNQPINGSPFIAKAWDINKVLVTNITSGRVGHQSSFNINVKEAGEGTLEIGICGPSGQNVTNNVSSLGPGHFVVSYIPLECGQHRINVTFNAESVNGNPFNCQVNDPSRVVARGEGLGFVKVGQSTSFTVSANGAQLKDVDVKITAPNNRDVTARISEIGANSFKVTYTPTMAGDYPVEISCFNEPITGSPFTAHASDISKVRVSNIPTGIVGQQSTFSIDVKEAGDCTLEISIRGPSGQNVSNTVNSQSPGIFVVNFTPTESGQHLVYITFNKEDVNGSPFCFMVIDISKATARGDGLGLVRCGQPTSFFISAPAAQLSDLDVTITGPYGKIISQRISESGANNFKVDYTPTLAGDYQIDIFYFNQAIQCSPFTAKAWDPCKVSISTINDGCVGTPSTFYIELKEAGEGTLEISICGPSGQNIPNNVVSLGPAQFEVSYTPIECGIHRANVTFNKDNITGSPFQFLVIDSSKVAVRGDGLNCVRANQLATFFVTAPPAQLKDLEVFVTGPAGKVIVPNITEQGNYTYRVDYTPFCAGDYKVDINYFCHPITNSPFTVKVWDACKVVVSDIATSYVGIQSNFQIDTRDAGDGSLEVVIQGPSGRNVPSTLTQLGPGRHQVSFVPTECGPHCAAVTFNRDSVPGSQFPFLVTDPVNATARGDGLGVVRCGQSTSFTVIAPGAQLNNVLVQITGPDGKDITCRVTETSVASNFLVEYIPPVVGQYTIAVSYFGQPITGSPFNAKAWCAAGVNVTGIKSACIGKLFTFNVNTSKAGEGCLDINVSSSGEIVPHNCKNLGKSSYDVSFTPYKPTVHLVTVKFNSEMVPGSPFNVAIIDGSRVTASGPGLGGCILANKPTNFYVNTKMVDGDCNLDVTITSPRGQQVMSKISGTSATGYTVEYCPTEAGCHQIDIKYAEMPISGSPFCTEVYDPCQVRLGRLPIGIVGKPVCFDVDTCMAGQGRLCIDACGHITRPVVELILKSGGVYTATFVPQESVDYTLTVTFNDTPVPGSPLTCTVIDVCGLCVNWEAIRHCPVNVPVCIELDPKQTPDADVTCTVTDPSGGNQLTKLSRNGRVYKIEFSGRTVGQYNVDLRYGGVAVPGSVFTVCLYDIKKIRISDVSTNCNVGQLAYFTVDWTGANIDDGLEVEVMCNQQRVPTQSQTLTVNKCRHSFTPVSPFDHVISVRYNNDEIPGSPMIVRVVNPAGQMSLCCQSDNSKLIPVGNLVTAVIYTQGIAINPQDLSIKVTAPNRELIVHRLMPLPDNNIKVEYTSRLSGTHCMEAQYAGQMIHGSPLNFDLFDPTKILVEGTRGGTVGELLILDVSTMDAGKGDLVTAIKNSRNDPVPFEVRPSPGGHQIRYTPTECGVHTIHMSYGGTDVQGCPIQQHIEDTFTPSVSGEGLIHAFENRPTSFTVNASGRSGDLSVSVDGPNSIARSTIDQEGNGIYRVTYTPVEVGIYDITICWNGQLLPGCPYKSRVCNPDKLMVVGGWQNFLRVDNKMQLELNKLKRIEFDSSSAGPGELRVEVTGPNNNKLPVDVSNREPGRYIASFMPELPGDYSMNVYWCEHLLSRSPILGTVSGSLQPASIPICDLPCDPCGIMVTGQGLTNARVQEEAEFIIDGSQAGQGMPVVELVGVKCDIEVQCIPIGPCRYRCVYTPTVPGAYLLSIAWGPCQVFGSPFKVTVVSGCDPSKVNLSGPGLTGGCLGQQLEFNVNTKRAGSGELSATCSGPTKSAFCKLEEISNGSYLLKVTPQEIGVHQLKVTFNGEQILNSPFSFRVQAVVDASKVRCGGPGLQSGILATFQSTFQVETRGAGPGKLTVKVRGPKGAFRVEMAKDPSQDRVILCRYNPTEVGQYVLHVKWSDQHVPGSPFPVTIVDTIHELETLHGSMENNGGFGGHDDDDLIFGGAGRVIGDGTSTIGSSAGLVFTDYN